MKKGLELNQNHGGETTRQKKIEGNKLLSATMLRERNFKQHEEEKEKSPRSNTSQREA
jgi:hypothetical protein